MNNLLDNEHIDRVHECHDIQSNTLNRIMHNNPELSVLIQSCGARALPLFYWAMAEEMCQYNPVLADLIERCGDMVNKELEQVEEQLCLNL